MFLIKPEAMLHQLSLKTPVLQVNWEFVDQLLVVQLFVDQNPDWENNDIHKTHPFNRRTPGLKHLALQILSESLHLRLHLF